MKAVLRQNMIVLGASKKKMERAYTVSLTVHLKTLEQKEPNTPKRSRHQEIIKLRARINQIETKRTIQRINKTRSWFFVKINKSDKPLARLTRGLRGTTPKIIKPEMKKETIKINWKFKQSSDPTTRPFTQQNWKIRTKLTIF